MTSEEGDLAAGIANAAQQNIVPVNLPSNSFTNIDLFGHVYASGFSDVTAGPPPAVAPGWAAPFQQRANQLFPDADMDLGSLDDWGPLFGDVVGHGSWLVADVAGVNGSDPLATSGNDTVFTTQIATNPNQLQDLEISVETPVGDYTVFSFDNDVIAAGGVHLFDYRLELGTGVGDQFQGHDPLGQDGQLQFLLEGSSADRQIEQTGTFELVDGNDPVSLHTLQFLGELSPGQGAQFQTQILVHDSVDGVTDGMARLTLRHLTEGIAGDYNGDYVVDQGDYDLWKETFGSDDGLADGNANGTIDAGDFTLWQDHFQQNHFPFTDFGGESRFGASSSAIPEPATGLISLLGLGASCLPGGSSSCLGRSTQTAPLAVCVGWLAGWLVRTGILGSTARHHPCRSTATRCGRAPIKMGEESWSRFFCTSGLISSCVATSLRGERVSGVFFIGPGVAYNTPHRL